MKIALKIHDFGLRSTNTELLSRFQVELYENCYIFFSSSLSNVSLEEILCYCCSHPLENTLRSKGETDNTSTDKTEHVLVMKPSFSFQFLSFFKRNSSNKYCSVAL